MAVLAGHRKGICILCVCKTTFLRKKEYRNALDKEIPIVTEIVVVGDLCAFVASAGRFKFDQVMQFMKYDKNNIELQYYRELCQYCWKIWCTMYMV